MSLGVAQRNNVITRIVTRVALPRAIKVNNVNPAASLAGTPRTNYVTTRIVTRDVLPKAIKMNGPAAADISFMWPQNNSLRKDSPKQEFSEFL